MPTSLQWNGDEQERQIRLALAEGLVSAAVFFVATHQRALDVSFPPASVEGEYPHGRTWNLRDSTKYDPESLEEIAAKLKVSIGYLKNAFYGLVLETKLHRLGLLETLERCRPQLAAYAVSGRMSG
jgi:hypothetical protein